MIIVIREAVDDESLVYRIIGKLMVVRFDELWGGEKLQPWLANGLKTEEGFHGKARENAQHNILWENTIRHGAGLLLFVVVSGF